MTDEKKLVLCASGSATDYLEARKVGDFVHVIGRADKAGPDEMAVRMLFVLGKEEQRQLMNFLVGICMQPPGEVVGIVPLDNLRELLMPGELNRGLNVNSLLLQIDRDVRYRGDRCLDSLYQVLDPSVNAVRICLRLEKHTGPHADGNFAWRRK